MSLKSPSTVQFFIELRSRLMVSLIVLFIVFSILLYFSNQLYTWLALPLLKWLPQGHLIATEIISPFFVPFKLAFMASFFLVMPFFLYQIWAFIAPALYTNERKFIWPALFVSGFLFYAGASFAYFVIFPMLFRFLAHIVPKGVVLSPDISTYLNFTVKLLLIFGTIFEIPVIMVGLVFLNITTCKRFIKLRPYAILGAFILGMLLAPPDVFSQTLLALPIWFLYEAGVLMSWLIEKKKHGTQKA